MQNKKKRQKGLILILVLWILFFLSVTVISLGARSRMNISLRALQNENMHMLYFAKSGINQALSVLAEDDPEFDSLSENWAQKISRQDEIGDLDIAVEDQNRYLNINTASEQIINNIRLLFPEITEEKVKAVIKNRPFNLITEVKEILEIDDDDFYGDKDIDRIGLADLVTTFSDGQLNINTASDAVLRVIPDMTDAAVESIISHRQNSPFTDNDQISQELSLLGLKPAQISSLVKFVRVDSNVFCISVKAKSKRKQVYRSLETIVKRQEGKFDFLLAKEN